MKVASLVLLCQTEGYQTIAELQPAARTEWLRTVKHMFKARVRNAHCLPPTLLERFPRFPSDLPPEIYNHAFEDEGPVLSKLTELQIEHLKSSTKMRAPRAVGLGQGVASTLSIMQPHHAPPIQFHGFPQLQPPHQWAYPPQQMQMQQLMQQQQMQR